MKPQTMVGLCFHCTWTRRFELQVIDHNVWRLARAHHQKYPDHHVIVLSSALKITTSFTPERPIE